ncbi:hypothetical protein [Tahibacter amnicola]|uniref:Uncharacterized protein n=1 Tax=Tahibacter amnicola TaxID=2976241 RepID=A0ABY6B7Z7_9GAMM|nr:hypothetical protein [Tahibacter amnicola]UXI65799.1 hypothetical protein N4264_13600 [Tahibacter amnicola]
MIRLGLDLAALGFEFEEFRLGLLQVQRRVLMCLGFDLAALGFELEVFGLGLPEVYRRGGGGDGTLVLEDASGTGADSSLVVGGTPDADGFTTPSVADTAVPPLFSEGR